MIHSSLIQCFSCFCCISISPALQFISYFSSHGVAPAVPPEHSLRPLWQPWKRVCWPGDTTSEWTCSMMVNVFHPMAPFCIAVEMFYGKKGSDETKSGKTKKWKWSERLVMKPFARIERSTWSSSLSLIFVCNFAYESNRNMLHKASLNALRMLSDKSRSCPNKTWQRIQHTEQSEFADCICRGPHGGKPNMPLRGNWQWRPGTVRWLRKDRTRPKDKTLMWDVFWTVLLEESMFTWFYCICIEKDTYYSLSLLYVWVLSGRYRMAKKVTSLRTLCKLLLWPKKLATWPVNSEQLRHPLEVSIARSSRRSGPAGRAAHPLRSVSWSHFLSAWVICVAKNHQNP